MICNGTLTSIAQPAAPGPDGATAWGTPVAMSARVQLSDVTSGQRYALGEAIADATAVMYVLKALVGANVPTKGGQAIAATDGGAAWTYRIEYVRDRQGGIAHYEVFLRL